MIKITWRPTEIGDAMNPVVVLICDMLNTHVWGISATLDELVAKIILSNKDAVICIHSLCLNRLRDYSHFDASMV